MKHFVKTNAKRITAAILCAVMCIAALPFSAFAFTAEEGKKVDAYYGAKYVGYDGEKYHSPATYQYITYDSSGNVSLHSKNAGGARTKLMIKDSSGARQVLCIESGVDYNANGTYTSESGKNNSYLRLFTPLDLTLSKVNVNSSAPVQTAEEKKTNPAPIILGIVGIIFAWVFALVGHITSIIGIVLGIREYKANERMAGLVLSIIGEVFSIFSSIIGAVIFGILYYM